MLFQDNNYNITKNKELLSEDEVFADLEFDKLTIWIKEEKVLEIKCMYLKSIQENKYTVSFIQKTKEALIYLISLYKST